MQFSVVFRRASTNTIIPLNQLRLTAFDVDGDSGPTHSISEVVWVAETGSLTFNAPTTLTDGGVAVDAFNWKKVIGEATQYTGTSNIAAISKRSTFTSL